MNPFSALSYLHSNIPSLLPELSSILCHRKSRTPSKKRSNKSRSQTHLHSSKYSKELIHRYNANTTTTITLPSNHPRRGSKMASSPSSPMIVPRYAIRRNNSTPTSHTTPPTRAIGRVPMDSYDHARYFNPSPADILSSSYPSPRTQTPTRSKHKKSSSSPSLLLSPPLAPRSPSSSTPPTPSLTSLASSSAVLLESEVEPLDLQQPTLPHGSSRDPVTTPAPTATPTSSLFFIRSRSASNTPAATPPASPALHATSTSCSAGPSPSTTPPSSPSPSFLATWHGRLPSIPRPSPLMPFRAAKKVVTSVTSVGSGLLPSKEQLGSIPVAGRILKHPVMDSTLTYIASKTTQRGAGAGSKAISPEDVHYRKLNKKLVDQAITLSALAIEREDQSKTIDDEAGDDAFELYLAAIAMLMHALPIETCDPLRREAFESQLRNFLQENQLDGETENDINSKQLRRRRRRRHREHLDQATSLIYQHSGAIASISSSSNAPHSPQGAQRKQRHGKSGHRSRNSCRGRRGKDADNAGPTLGEAIVATAVESAIRLKQSPIPDAIKTCYHASRTIFSKMDERFHIQDRAWQLSKQSIEKAIELDEQYAIHEVMTETFFATVTGLVKAGIAYKETPSYSTVKALVTQQHQSQDEVQAALPALEAERSHNPQTIVDYKEASSPSFTRRYSVITEEDEESTTVDDGTEAYDREIDESSSSEYASSDDEDDEGEVGNKFGRKHGRNPFEARRYGLFSQTAASALPGPYTDQTQQRVGLVMALRGAASLFMSGLASK